jgi:hypothetical protein
VLLFRGYFRNQTRLLLWCALFFAALAIENAILFFDFVVLPDVDLTVVRRIVPVIGVAILLSALIWETE